MKKSGYEYALDLIAGGCGRVHLMGVGGVGVAGLTAHLHWLGFEVSGCDLLEGELTDWLCRIGVEIQTGHAPAHITEGCCALIHSSAVPQDNAELMFARNAGIPIMRRGEVLSALVNSRNSIAVAGTHGKTTTVAMLAQTLRRGGVDAAFFVGAAVDCLGGVAGKGAGVFAVEADESDGTLVNYRPDCAVLTNAEVDHLENFGNEEALWSCFRRFAGQASRRVVCNYDDARGKEICSSIDGVLSYGFADASMVRGFDFVQEGNSCAFGLEYEGCFPGRISLPVSGLHNASNALAVCAVCLDMGFDFEALRIGLALYEPPRRRFEKVCDYRGAEVYLDYSHHPSEIKALLQSLENFARNRLVVVFQPHRFSRTLQLGADFPFAFEGVDELIIAPVYAASEQSIAGGTAADLYKHFLDYGNLSVRLAGSLRVAWEDVREKVGSHDILLFVGAGDIDTMAKWAREE